MPFELLQFISDLIDEQQQIIGDRCLLSFRITGNTKGFRGDQQLLRLVLMNLLSIAIKSEEREIEVHLNGRERDVAIKVKTAGMQLVDPEGLEFAIVRACIDVQGGEVGFDLNHSQFVISLPKRSI